MAETVVVEIFEYECKSSSGWIPDPNLHWCLKSTKEQEQQCQAPEEYVISDKNFAWTSNWRIDKKQYVTDNDGWEYGTNKKSFHKGKRLPRGKHFWKDKARRRLWTRIMKRETMSTGSRVIDLAKSIHKIQIGLKSIQASRVRIDEIIRTAPAALESLQMQEIIQTVKKNICDITAALENTEQLQGANTAQSHYAVIKKLRNDLAKEEIAIERALYQNSSNSVDNMKGNYFVPLRKLNSNSFLVASSNRRNMVATTRGSISEIVSSEVSRNSVAVKSGRADAFDPYVLASSNPKTTVHLDSLDNKTNQNHHLQDGVFFDRSIHLQMIEQKLKPIDEATIMQEIIDERSEEITKVNKGLLEVNEMFIDLSRIVQEQQVLIDTIDDNVDESYTQTKIAYDNIVEANIIQKTSNCIIC